MRPPSRSGSITSQHLRTGIASGESALVRQVGRHLLQRQALAHYIGVVELKPSRSKQHLEETSTLLEVDHLVQGRCPPCRRVSEYLGFLSPIAPCRSSKTSNEVLAFCRCRSP